MLYGDKKDTVGTVGSKWGSAFWDNCERKKLMTCNRMLPIWCSLVIAIYLKILWLKIPEGTGKSNSDHF